MKRHEFVNISVLLLLIFTILTQHTFCQNNAISEVKFHFQHSLRVPNHYVTVLFQTIQDSVKVHVKSDPRPNVSKKWDKTKRNYSFNIGKDTFNNIITSIKLIKCSDVMTAPGFIGNDGTSCEIEFGSYGNAIKYRIWSPGYDTEERMLQSFLNACKLILRTARLNPAEIL